MTVEAEMEEEVGGGARRWAGRVVVSKEEAGGRGRWGRGEGGSGHRKEANDEKWRCSWRWCLGEKGEGAEDKDDNKAKERLKKTPLRKVPGA